MFEGILGSDSASVSLHLRIPSHPNNDFSSRTNGQLMSGELATTGHPNRQCLAV